MMDTINHYKRRMREAIRRRRRSVREVAWAALGFWLATIPFTIAVKFELPVQLRAVFLCASLVIAVIGLAMLVMAFLSWWNDD